MGLKSFLLSLSFFLFDFRAENWATESFFVLFLQDKGRSTRKICFKRFSFRCIMGKHNVSHPYNWIELVDAAAPDPDHV